MQSKPVRLSIKGIILKDQAILCLKHEKQGSIYYTLPGGGQEWGETITETVKRECLEEANVEVEPHEVLFIRDYIGKNHEFAEQDPEVHQVEIMMRCSVLEERDASVAVQPDDHQIGIEWIPINKLKAVDFYPKVLKEKMEDFLKGGGVWAYLGDVN